MSTCWILYVADVNHSPQKCASGEYHLSHSDSLVVFESDELNLLLVLAHHKILYTDLLINYLPSYMVRFFVCFSLAYIFYLYKSRSMSARNPWAL